MLYYNVYVVQVSLEGIRPRHCAIHTWRLNLGMLAFFRIYEIF